MVLSFLARISRGVIYDTSASLQLLSECSLLQHRASVLRPATLTCRQGFQF